MLHRLAFLAFLWSSTACQSSQTEENETALLLLRVQEYTGTEGQEQVALLATLQNFHPTSPRVREARDTCVAAYTLVQRAEREHADAKDLLEQVTSGKRPLVATRDEIERKIDRSNSAIAAARPKISRCTRLLSDLRREHRRTH
jgi:hypothetical protein